MNTIQRVDMILTLLAKFSCAICATVHVIKRDSIASGIYIVAAALFGIWFELISQHNKDCEVKG